MWSSFAWRDSMDWLSEFSASIGTIRPVGQSPLAHIQRHSEAASKGFPVLFFSVAGPQLGSNPWLLQRFG